MWGRVRQPGSPGVPEDKGFMGITLTTRWGDEKRECQLSGSDWHACVIDFTTPFNLLTASAWAWKADGSAILDVGDLSIEERDAPTPPPAQ